MDSSKALLQRGNFGTSDFLGVEKPGAIIDQLTDQFAGQFSGQVWGQSGANLRQQLLRTFLGGAKLVFPFRIHWQDGERIWFGSGLNGFTRTGCVGDNELRRGVGFDWEENRFIAG